MWLLGATGRGPGTGSGKEKSRHLEQGSRVGRGVDFGARLSREQVLHNQLCDLGQVTLSEPLFSHL